jgi:hypothetical protein
MGWLRRRQALSIHRDVVTAVKNFAKERFGHVPNPALVCPESFGKKSLRFFMPPMMEEVFGYGGNLRFVEFSYCPRNCQIAYSDGGDEFATDGALWMEFVNHPVVAKELGEDRYPTLYGKGLESSKAEHDSKGVDSLLAHPVGHWDCLMFDREQRRVYLFKRIELLMFFPLCEEMDDHTVLADGRLVSPGCEEQKARASVDAVEAFLRWLDMAWEIRRLADESFS